MRERSIFRTLVIPLLILLAVEAVVFVAMLYASGVFSRLDSNDRELFDKQVQNRASYLNNYMERAVRSLGDLSGQIRYAGYGSNTQAMVTLYMDEVRQETRATEVFILTEEDASSEKDRDYYRIPFQAALEREMQSASSDAEAYAFWGYDTFETEAGIQNGIVCTVPLIAGYGAPYGVAGIRIYGEELYTILPYDELLYGENASYIICVDAMEGEGLRDAFDMTQAAYSGARPGDYPAGAHLYLRASGETGYSHTVRGEAYYVSVAGLYPYTENSIRSESHWYLAGSVRSTVMYQYSTQIVRTILLTMLLMVLTGIIGSLIISRHISGSIKRLSDEVANAQKEKLEIPHLSVTGISEIDNFAGAITAMSRDMMQQRSLEMKRIEHERDYDLLTGLLTRRAFLTNCARIFATPDLLGCAAMLMIDLDNVKVINDNYGHDTGDAYIRMAAQVFNDVSPEQTLLAKVAGDEFYILYYGFVNRNSLEMQIDALRKAVSEARLPLPEEQSYGLTVTGGVAWYPEDGANHEELMRLAEFATYQLKNTKGKGRIVNFDRNEYLRSASAVKQHKEFEQLLENYKLASYHFQPIFDAKTGQVHAYEALMRVNLVHLKMPSEVLELARHAGRMVDIERMTWMRSMECYEELLHAHLVEKDAKLFINSISSLSLPDRDVRKISGMYGDLLHRVVIEITESEFMNEDATERKRNIPGFSGLFALDDYGSGYNSERTLLELTPKYIKVDLSIIRNIDSSPDKQRIVSNIVRYAHERNMLIIAEGIETAQEMETVCKLGADLLQGYFLARSDQVPPALSSGASDILDQQLIAGELT
ncbi:MAG: bifunctional diguanylate cyclase/phosphodiesterase [Lachnospiraceae bacterium]|nr:bifunctional diguanylate cyclase/phosphodiesterase [Lachnospiraceae bacterium]